MRVHREHHMGTAAANARGARVWVRIVVGSWVPTLVVPLVDLALNLAPIILDEAGQTQWAADPLPAPPALVLAGGPFGHFAVDAWRGEHGRATCAVVARAGLQQRDSRAVRVTVASPPTPTVLPTFEPGAITWLLSS